MSAKKNNEGGFVYSTNPFFKPENEENSQEDLPNNQIQLRVFLDRLGGNKMVSRVSGFPENYSGLDETARSLKQKCGVGGSVKNDEILIQGDHRDKIVTILLNNGFKAKKAGG